MTAGMLIDRLAVLPETLLAAEMALLEAEEARQAAQVTLQDAEDLLLLDGEGINGRNAEVRAAQVRAETVEERAIVEEAGRRLARLKVRLHQLQAEHASLRAIARLLAATSD